MQGDEDGVVLTDQEREVLAGLAATLDDPWLAQQLLGDDWPPPARRPRTFPCLRHWAGAVLTVLGALICTATFTFRLWAAVVGMAVMAAGTWLLWHDRVALRDQAGWPPASTASP